MRGRIESRDCSYLKRKVDADTERSAQLQACPCTFQGARCRTGVTSNGRPATGRDIVVELDASFGVSLLRVRIGEGLTGRLTELAWADDGPLPDPTKPELSQ